MRRPLILLFGMPRSGTTWIGKIFDSHPDVLYRHEPDTSVRLSEIPLAPNATEDVAKYCETIRRYERALTKISLPKVAAKLPFFEKNFSSNLRFNVYKLSAIASAVGSRVSKDIKIPIVSPVTLSEADNITVVWKSIESLGRLGLVVRCVDDCRGVHILRHPCGYIASVVRGESSKKFVSNTAASEDYGLFEQLVSTDIADEYGVSIDRLKAMSSIERLAWRWVLFNEKALKDCEALDECMAVRYEDICADPIAQAKAMFNFSELPWNSQTESFLNESTSTEKDAYYSVYKSPLVAANKWKKQLEREQIKTVMRVIENSKRLSELYN